MLLYFDTLEEPDAVDVDSDPDHDVTVNGIIARLPSSRVCSCCHAGPRNYIYSESTVWPAFPSASPKTHLPSLLRRVVVCWKKTGHPALLQQIPRRRLFLPMCTMVL